MNKTLGDLCLLIRNGKSIKQAEAASGLPITRIETISKGFIDTTRVGYANVSPTEAETYILEPGDILFSHINSVEHLGKVAIYEGSPKNLVHGMNLLCLRPNKDLIIPKFLFHYLTTPKFKAQLARFIKPAVNQASVTTSDLKTIAIPFPPMAEQRRIAAILDKVDELRSKRRQTLARLDELVQSTFLEMFGEPNKNTKGWKVVPAGEVYKIELGKMRSAKNITGKHLKPYLRNANVQWGRIDTSSIYEMDFIPSEEERYRLLPGDILVCEGGEVGRTAIFRGEIENCFYQNALHRLRPLTLEIDPEYFVCFMRMASLTGLIQKYTSQVTIAHFTAEKFRVFPLVLPPIELQKKFSAKVSKIQSLKENYIDSFGLLTNLTGAIQYQEFT